MTTVTQDPLAAYKRLSQSIYIHDPLLEASDQSHNSTASLAHRPTIVIAFWYSAAPRALVKYVVEYTKLAPNARIIFILSGWGDYLFTLPTEASHRRRLLPAITAIRAANGPVFVHVFSNGGIFNLAHVLLGYRHETAVGGDGGGGRSLPMSGLILDSGPGKSTPTTSVKAMSYALPRAGLLRQLGLAALWTYMFMLGVLRKITFATTEDSLQFSREALLDETLVATHMRRCYIYSDADELVTARDVEEHANRAAAKGWLVQREKFHGTPHVGHMRADPARYWGIVTKYLKGIQ